MTVIVNTDALLCKQHFTAMASIFVEGVTSLKDWDLNLKSSFYLSNKCSGFKKSNIPHSNVVYYK